MQYHWLNKKNNNKLIIFFAGWSFDYNPFKFLDCTDFDVLILYDYNNLNLPEIPKYQKYYLISWSMGVFTAYMIKNQLPKFDLKIAINGTPYPVDDTKGIPLKPFLLTLKHAKQGLEGKFYQNIFDNPKELETYNNHKVNRTIDNRVDELNNLYKLIKQTQINYESFYDFAIISKNDIIIPTKNQINFWTNNTKNIKMLESGHFPFYNFKSWEEILKCK